MWTDGKIENFVVQKIKLLYTDKPNLARLRRGVGKQIGELPELIEYVLLPDSMTAVQEQFVSEAVYTALTLYALHQQGKSGCMCEFPVDKGNVRKSVSFGTAVRKLCNENTRIAVTRRFERIMTSKDVLELSIHSRSLISQMRQKDIALDYGRFATDLYWFQQPKFRRLVILQWGKDFYKEIKEDK